MMLGSRLLGLRMSGVGLMHRGLTRLHPMMLEGRMFRLGAIMDMRGGYRFRLVLEARRNIAER